MYFVDTARWCFSVRIFVFAFSIIFFLLKKLHLRQPDLASYTQKYVWYLQSNISRPHNLIGSCKIIMLTNNRERARKQRIPPIPGTLTFIYCILSAANWALCIQHVLGRYFMVVGKGERLHSDSPYQAQLENNVSFPGENHTRPLCKSYADSQFTITVSHL